MFYAVEEAGNVGETSSHCVNLSSCRLSTHQLLSTKLRLHEKTIRKKYNYSCILENVATQPSIRP